MIYDIKEGCIYDRKVKLSPKEEQFLNLLIINKVLTHEMLKEHGFTDTTAKRTKTRLMEKAFIEIETLVGIGYRLKTEIKFVKEK